LTHIRRQFSSIAKIVPSLISSYAQTSPAASLTLNFLCDVCSQLCEQIKASTVSVDRLHLRRSIILPPVLKAYSEGTVEAGTASTSFAKRDNIGYLLEFTFQYSNISNSLVIFSRLSARYLDHSDPLDSYSISSICCSNLVAWVVASISHGFSSYSSFTLI
jgi:hypothetical protein